MIRLLVALALVGCNGERTMGPPPRSDDASDLPAGDDAQGEVAAPPAPAPAEASASCLPLPGADGATSDDCFPFDTCRSCDIGRGLLYWCGIDAGSGAHPAIPGCEQDNVAQSGWVGACCPVAPPSCSRLSSNDAFCKSQNLTGSPPPTVAYACPAESDAAPAATGCQPPYPTSDAGPGAPTTPGAHADLYCCAN